MNTFLKVLLAGLFLIAAVNYAAYLTSRDRFSGLTETKLRKKHFCSPSECQEARSVLNYSLERNRWCLETANCPPTSVNTVFLTELEDLQADWTVVETGGGTGLVGKYLVRTWKCSSLTSPDPYCRLGARSCCYPGPFLDNGHLQYRDTQCQAEGC